MKLETRIQLIKMAEKAKRVQAEDYPRRWTNMGYVGAVLLSLVGVYCLNLAITIIVEDKTDFLGTIFLLVALIFTISPWYFIIRFNLNRNIELLCEAILSVNTNDPISPAPPAAPVLPPRGTRKTRKTRKTRSKAKK
jgi:hypothetical protein